MCQVLQCHICAVPAEGVPDPAMKAVGVAVSCPGSLAGRGGLGRAASLHVSEEVER